MPVEIIVSTRQLPVKDLLNAVCDELDQLEALYGTKTPQDSGGHSMHTFRYLHQGVLPRFGSGAASLSSTVSATQGFVLCAFAPHPPAPFSHKGEGGV
jgi:hypothetical protein